MSFLTLKYKPKVRSRRTDRSKRTTPTARSKRNANTSPTSPQVLHSPNNDGKQSIKLTMKVAPSKLREVMRATELESLQDTLGGGKVLDAPRSSRRAQQAQASTRIGTRPKYTEVHESDSDEEEEEEDEEEDAEGDEDDDVEDTTMNDFDEVGAEAEGNTDDDDVEMEDETPPVRKGPNPPKAPKITLKTPAKKSQIQPPRPKVIVTPADVGPVQSVEDQEMQDDEDDDDEDDEEEEEDDVTNVDDETNLNDEDAEGEDEAAGEGPEIEGEEVDEDEEDDDLDSDDEEDDDDEPGSGTGTPDPTKMTSRQRGRPIEPLMALDMAPQQRKFFTDEEKAMKKDEHARKRKELTKRKTQEEKNAALNRLLKPQVSKTRGAAPKAETLAAQLQAVAEEEEIEQKADHRYTRWVSTKDGIKLGVPEEWLGKSVGRYFGPPLPTSNGALIQEVD